MGTNLNKKLIVIDGKLGKIKSGTKKLLKEAEACFKEIDKQAVNINSVVSGLPSDVKDQGLVSTLSSLSANKLCTDDFDKTARKIEKSLNDLSKNLSTVDSQWKTQAAHTKSDLDLLKGLAKSYRGLIGDGGVNINDPLFVKKFSDFVKKTETTRAEVGLVR